MSRPRRVMFTGGTRRFQLGSVTWHSVTVRALIAVEVDERSAGVGGILTTRRRTVAGALLMAASLTGVVGRAAPAAVAGPGCQLGNGIQHVIHLTFDNVHFTRDNPNVPSDLEKMPNLLNFFLNNGVLMSNNHTPLIAHTANDSLTQYSGLYGDRHGMPVSNSYEYSNGPNVTSADSFVYWTSPIIDHGSQAPSTTDHNPSMIYSPTVPPTPVATGTPGV